MGRESSDSRYSVAMVRMLSERSRNCSGEISIGFTGVILHQVWATAVLVDRAGTLARPMGTVRTPVSRNAAAKFVLQSKEKIYRLDTSDEAEPFTGVQVKIVCTLDPKTNTSLPDSAVRDRIVEIIQLQLSRSKVSSHFSTSGHVVAAVPIGSALRPAHCRGTPLRCARAAY